MPSNGTYICVKCHETKRGDIVFSESSLPKCNNCRQHMEFIGKHWRVPKKEDKKGWTELLLKLKQKRSRLSGI